MVSRVDLSPMGPVNSPGELGELGSHSLLKGRQLNGSTDEAQIITEHQRAHARDDGEDVDTRPVDLGGDLDVRVDIDGVGAATHSGCGQGINGGETKSAKWNRHRKPWFGRPLQKPRESLVQLGKTLPEKDQEKAKTNGPSYSQSVWPLVVGLALILSYHCLPAKRAKQFVRLSPVGGIVGDPIGDDGEKRGGRTGSFMGPPHAKYQGLYRLVPAGRLNIRRHLQFLVPRDPPSLVSPFFLRFPWDKKGTTRRAGFDLNSTLPCESSYHCLESRCRDPVRPHGFRKKERLSKVLTLAAECAQELATGLKVPSGQDKDTSRFRLWPLHPYTRRALEMGCGEARPCSILEYSVSPLVMSCHVYKGVSSLLWFSSSSSSINPIAPPSFNRQGVSYGYTRILATEPVAIPRQIVARYLAVQCFFPQHECPVSNCLRSVLEAKESDRCVRSEGEFQLFD